MKNPQLLLLEKFLSPPPANFANGSLFHGCIVAAYLLTSGSDLNLYEIDSNPSYLICDFHISTVILFPKLRQSLFLQTSQICKPDMGRTTIRATV